MIKKFQIRETYARSRSMPSVQLAKTWATFQAIAPTFLFFTKYSSKADTRGRVSVRIRAMAIMSRLAVAMMQQLAIYNVCQIPSIVGEMAQAKADGEINPAHVNTNASHRSPCLVATPALLFAA